MNDGGQVVFYAKSSTGSCGLYRGDGTAPPTLLAGPGMSTVDGPLAADSLCPGGVLPTRPPLTNSGLLTAFEARVGALTGIYVNVGPVSAPPYPKVARESDAAPAAIGGAYGVPSLLDVSDAGGGEVLLRSPVVGGCASEGLFLASMPGPSVSTLARAGGACADSAATGGSYASLGSASMNNTGRVAFHGTAPIGDEIDWTGPPYTSRTKVVADGDAWAGDPLYGSTLDLLGEPMVNDAGQVSFRAASSGPYGEGYYQAPSTDQPDEDGAGAGSCGDGLDNGGDGFSDGADADCAQEDGAGDNSCYDGLDNGGDNLADASDPDCARAFYGASQLQGGVVGADPTVLGGTITPCPGDAGPLRGARSGLVNGGQLISIGCGADPIGIIAFPSFQKLIKDGEALPLPLPAGNTFSDFSTAAASPGGMVSFGATGTAPCLPSTSPCTGLFTSNASAACLDKDGDGLCDDWETSGMDVNQDGIVDLNLPALGASPNHKDVFVEIDYMDCAVAGSDCAAPPGNCTIGGAAINVGHNHMPNAGQEIADVVASFNNAPVNNPDAVTGINLHVLVDEGVRHRCFSTWNPAQPTPCKPLPPVGTFEWYKCQYFTTAADRASANAANIKAAKQQVYHYSLWTHQRGVLDCTSGSGEVWGNDFYVSLGGLRDINNNGAADAADGPCWGADGFGQAVGTRNERSGTFMHELGHNLALCHGGPLLGGPDRGCAAIVSDNYKPNYLSVMNYTFQMDHIVPRGTAGVNDSGSFLDYSRWLLPPLACAPAAGVPAGPRLDETKLDESLGIDCNAPPAAPLRLRDWLTAYTVPRDTNGDGTIDTCNFRVVPATGAGPVFGNIDWLFNGKITGPTVNAGGPVQAGINDPSSPPITPLCTVENTGVLWGFQDWTRLQYDFRKSRANYSDGLPHSPLVPEQTAQSGAGQAPFADDDSDGVINAVDNCPDTPNAAQTNTDIALAQAGASIVGDAAGDACDLDDDNDSLSATRDQVGGSCPAAIAEPDFKDCIESFVGTDPLDPCANTATADDEATDKMPADLNDDKVVSVTDRTLTALAIKNYAGGAGVYNTRYDLNAGGTNNVTDRTIVVLYIKLTASASC